MKCFDEDFIMDDFVGENRFKVIDLLSLERVPLNYKGSLSAEIVIEASFTPKQPAEI